VARLSAAAAGARFDGVLDRLARRDVRLLGRPRSAFHACGWLGLLAAGAVVALAGAAHHLPAWALLAMLATGVAMFLSLAAAVRWATGQERLIYYHHEIAVLAAVALLLGLARQPVARGLDVAALGLGAFLACGRIGCLSAGCCHGRPARWGIRYGPEHAELGLPSCLMGVRLVPIQLVESLLVAGAVATGLAVVLAGGQPGEAASLYVVAYAALRFVLEFLRGDPDRRYLAGFSEAQWTGVVILLGTAGVELSGVLPVVWWHMAAALGLLAAAAAIAGVRRARDGQHDLLHARHLVAIANTLARAPEPGDGVSVARTSLGLCISGGAVASAGRSVHHYSLSRAGQPLRPREARALARVIVALRHRWDAWTLTPGRSGVFHVVVACEPGLLARSGRPHCASTRAPADNSLPSSPGHRRGVATGKLYRR
jgi:hypothetical protein